MVTKGIFGAVSTNEYDIIKLDESFSFDDVKALGICTHAGFRIPNQNDIVGALKMFPNLERVDYNVIDSRLKDKVYWPLKLTDIGDIPEIKTDSILLEWLRLSHRTKIKELEGNKIKLDYSKETYSSDIPMSFEIYGMVKSGYDDILSSNPETMLNELKERVPLIEVDWSNIKTIPQPSVYSFAQYVDELNGRDQHPLLNDSTLSSLLFEQQCLKQKPDYKPKYPAFLIESYVQVVGTNQDYSKMWVRDYGKLNRLHWLVSDAAEHSALAGTDYLRYLYTQSLGQFQAKMHGKILEGTLDDYNKFNERRNIISENAQSSNNMQLLYDDIRDLNNQYKRNGDSTGRFRINGLDELTVTYKPVQFSGVKFISRDKLSRPSYNHVLEDHNNQQAVYLPVLQGAGNGDVKKHKEYILDKYVRAHEENGGQYDIPRIIITPKKFRSIFSM